MKKQFTLLMLALMAMGAMAQSTLKVSGEFRPRSEYSHGYGTLASVDQKGSLFTSQRTRVNLEYGIKNVKTKVSLQDVRIWGNQAQQVSNEDLAVSIHEAWAETPLVKGLSLRVGRQELNYDNGRMFGNSNWNQQGRVHDLALLKFSGFVEVHFGLAYHQSGNRKNNFYQGPDAYKTLQFLWINKSFGDLKISVLGLNNGIPKNTLNDQDEIIDQEIIYTQTFGPYAEYKKGNLNFAGNAYYQTGKLVNGKSLSAYEFLLEATWKPVKDFSLGAGYEELSGSAADLDPTQARSFNPLYGTGHKFNGHMDYFYVGNHVGSVGLRDLYAKVGYQIKGISLGLDVHQFWAQADLVNKPNRILGTELDFYGGYKLNDVTELGIGYSHMLPTETMQLLKGGSVDAVHNWAWVMFTFKPQASFSL